MAWRLRYICEGKLDYELELPTRAAAIDRAVEDIEGGFAGAEDEETPESYYDLIVDNCRKSLEREGFCVILSPDTQDDRFEIEEIAE